MTEQRWKKDPALYNAPTEKKGVQVKKKLDYNTTYRKEFLDADPIRDWESIDRCIWLWEWAIKEIKNDPIYRNDVIQKKCIYKILDCGSKDGQFPNWLLKTKEYDAFGIEISKNYIKYAREKGRPVVKMDVCKMPNSWSDNFDFVFGHHLLGLVKDNLEALEEMYRVTNKYLINLSQIPGNPKKHYSYMKDNKLFNKFIKDNSCYVLYNDYLDTGYGSEYVIFIRKEK